MKTVPLGELVTFYSGGTPSKSNPGFWDGDIPWFSAKDLKRDRLTDSIDHISNTVFDATSLKKLPAGTIAMVVRGMILAHTVPISVLDVEAAINQDLKALLPRQEIETSYLAAMLRAQHGSVLGQVSTAAHGTKKLESRVLEELPIPVPSLAEQRRIAAILDKADAIRANRRQILTHLDTLTQSIFHEMFGTAAGFETALLKDIVKWSSGKFLPAKEQRGGPFPVFGGNGVNGHHDEYMFDARRLVVGRVGVYCGVVHVTPPKAWVTDNALVATITFDGLSLDYLASALAVADLNQYASVSAQPSISGSRIGDVRISVPSVDAQHEFATRVEQINTQRAVVQHALAVDDELFASLQARAFKGEL